MRKSNGFLPSAQAAYHFGNVLGSLVGEAMVRSGLPLVSLFYASWGCTTIGAATFLFLPAPVRTPRPSLVGTARRDGIASALVLLGEAYRDPCVRAWSAWWVLGFGCYAIIANYYQLQFLDIDPSSQGVHTRTRTHSAPRTSNTNHMRAPVSRHRLALPSTLHAQTNSSASWRP